MRMSDIIEEFIKKRGKHLKVGIIGWGPIGQCHFRLIDEMFSDYIDNIYIYAIDLENHKNKTIKPV